MVTMVALDVSVSRGTYRYMSTEDSKQHDWAGRLKLSPDAVKDLQLIRRSLEDAEGKLRVSTTAVIIHALRMAAEEVHRRVADDGAGKKKKGGRALPLNLRTLGSRRPE